MRKAKKNNLGKTALNKAARAMRIVGVFFYCFFLVPDGVGLMLFRPLAYELLSLLGPFFLFFYCFFLVPDGVGLMLF